MDKTRNILMFFLIFAVFYLLSILSSILIPLVLALLFAIVFQPLVNIFKKWKLPDALIFPIISIITLGIIFVLFNIILQTSYSIASEKDFLVDRLNLKIESIINWISGLGYISVDSNAITDSIEGLFSVNLLTTAAGSVASSVGSFAGSFFMFALYYITLLAGLSNYKNFILYLGGDENKGLLETYEKVTKSIFSYVIIKTIISLFTGVLVGIVCASFGIRFPIFWAFLTFLLNFIPSIGSIIATLPPLLMGIIQFDSVQTISIIAVLLVLIQTIMGNIVEPKVMGDKLRLNTVTVIFGLVFWGYIWGISGMMLSVPLLVILKVIFEHIPSLHIFARLMGSPDKAIKGKKLQKA